MSGYVLHYGGDTFELKADEITAVEQAFSVVGGGNVVVVTLDRDQEDGTTTRRRFVFSEGVPIYLTITDFTED